MFNKILIANRGEIACRIIRTCRKLGIKTVAIFSEADRHGLHIRMADEAHLVGDSPPPASYLNMDKILEIARTTGAEAIHPGYGFLSQNPVFARRCQEAGICFIGPKPEVMEKMGDKLRARKLAKKAGLPVLPGTDEAVDDAQVTARAWELGFPLMVKAAAGGGGIGIYIVESMDELTPIIERTRQLASSAFGSPQLYFERHLQGASHIEVQLIGDEQGHLVHLFERDCSIQRRNQKLVEETPATKLTPRLRRQVCNLALKLARRISYTNAGTVEFLLSPDGQIYFLEMNTRLQVEHGVTELVTGLDLVELQIRVAAGEPLPLAQKDIRPRGHAIEARIYPEDPETLIPDAGNITELHQPSGEYIRVDSALFKGYEVTLHYEPLLAKVMAWGETREEAAQRLLRALLAFRLEGIKCNISLLRDVLVSKEFASATHDTNSLVRLLEGRRSDRHQLALRQAQDRLMNGRRPEKADREVAAAIGVALALAMQRSLKSPHPPFDQGGSGGIPAAASAWRVYGRRQQILSRTLGNRGWR